ncbi:MAG: hypothetical protein K2Q12_04855, partial [Rickettsiales bacterium]|nr:hypothetical protein [Rickettsiales bacterium]
KGLKSLYYCRSTSLQRAEKGHNNAEAPAIQLEMSLLKKERQPVAAETSDNKYDECLACQ